jgi:hypothetical protein
LPRDSYLPPAIDATKIPLPVKFDHHVTGARQGTAIDRYLRRGWSNRNGAGSQGYRGTYRNDGRLDRPAQAGAVTLAIAAANGSAVGFHASTFVAA